ncbi:MAG: hypothetical protein F6K41_02835 [Symploca sp. SIO3E6]|nr:hypothetical protein [Caldora sp. SIO3E6]
MSVNKTDDLTGLELWLRRLVAGFSAVGLLVILPYLWWLNVTPIYQQESILKVKDFFELKNQAIQSVITSIQIYATVFGGIAILLNVYYGAKRAKAMEDNASATTQNAIAATKNAEVAEQGQITERFTKAIEQIKQDGGIVKLFCQKILRNQSAEDSILYDYPRRAQEDIREYLRRTAEIIELGAWETAIASAIFILETIIPLMGQENQIDFETKTPTELLQIFCQNNLISPDNRDTLIEAIALRDAFMIQQETIESDRDFAQRVLAIVTQLFQTIDRVE